MTSRDFCYWLQGYFEIEQSGTSRPNLTEKQVETIRNHLSMVFKHEIDPSMGPQTHQDVLNLLHQQGMPPSDQIARC